jgi:hypothetical protein
MGYGEFGGGGSVRWQVLYDDPNDATQPGKNPTGRKRRGHGKDQGTDTEEGKKLFVRCTQARLIGLTGTTIELEVTLDKNKDDQVVIRWGNDPFSAWPTTPPVSVTPASGPGGGTGGGTGRQA